MKKQKIKGKLTWDDSDMMEFLEAQAKEWIATTEDKPAEEAPF